MTDGAARLLELLGDDELKERALSRLTSRDPLRFWTSGQWMTERTGGSDVGRAETIARRDGKQFRLYGPKWFTSATTSQMAMTLGRIEDDDGSVPAGSRGLSLFYLETTNAQGELNAIEIHRLKDKLGTRALPTAELDLCGTPARLLGKPGDGVRNIAHLLNITRIYNAITSVAFMQRGLALARDYARRREAFGRTLAQLPLHVETLADLEVELHGAFHLAFHAVELLGKQECNTATDDERAVLRLLTPLTKLYTGKRAVSLMSEVVECFGGAGYVEDSALPRLLRDTQVLSIWEGTTNVLSLDALRAIDKEQALGPLLRTTAQRLEQISRGELSVARDHARQALGALKAHLPHAMDLGLEAVQTGARRFAFGLARTFAAGLLLEHAQWAADNEDPFAAVAIGAARRWCQQGLAPLVDANEAYRAESRTLSRC